MICSFVHLGAQDLSLQKASIAVEFMLQARLGGQAIGTPMLDGLSIFGRMGGVPRSHLSILSSFHLGRSPTALDQVNEKVFSSEGTRFSSFLRTIHGNGILGDRLPLVISDNLNSSSSNRLGYGDRHRISSINSLTTSLPQPPHATPISPTPFLIPYNPLSLRTHLFNLGRDHLDHSFEGIPMTTNPLLPSLYSFTPHPLIPGQSSSSSDITTLILEGIMENEMKVKERPAVIVVDPEPYNIITTSLMRYPANLERWRYMIPMIGLFHLRLHLASGLLLDHHSFLLLFQHIFPSLHSSDHCTNRVRMAEQLLSTFTPKSHTSNIIKSQHSLLTCHLTKSTSSSSRSAESLFWPNSTFMEKKWVCEEEGDVDFLLTAHLCELSTRLGKKRGHSTSSRGNFTFWRDPKKCLLVLRTFHRVWKKMMEGGQVQLPTSNLGIRAIHQIWEEVDCLVRPFDSLFLDGDASLLFTYLPKMLMKISYDHHPNLLRGYLPFLHLLQHWRETNPGILSFITHHLHFLSDSHIENFNSVVSRGRASNRAVDFSSMAMEVAIAPERRKVRDQLIGKKIGHSEVAKEYLLLASQERQLVVRTVLIRLMERYFRLEPLLPSAGPLQPMKFGEGKEVMLQAVKKLGDIGPETPPPLVPLHPYLQSFMIGSIRQIWYHVFVDQDITFPSFSSHERPDGEEECEDIHPPSLPTPPTSKKMMITQILTHLYNTGVINEDEGSLTDFIDDLDDNPIDDSIDDFLMVSLIIPLMILLMNPLKKRKILLKRKFN